MKKNYSDLLKDPRWQKKRLEILQRDDFRCQSCDDNTSTLHVHHLKYDNDLKPWEYENDDLITLCETCHEAYHYLSCNKTIGFETFILVIRLIDKLEQESIQHFFEVIENG